MELLAMTGRGLGVLLAAAACLAAAPAPAQDIDDGEAETLREALARAYGDNPSLQAARANQRATDADVPIARSDLLPGLSGQATLTEFLKQSGSFGGPDRSLSGQLSLAIPVYTP